MTLVLALVWVLQAYALVGAIFAVAFLTRGVGAIDAGARGAGIGFKLLVAPGCVALWPLLLRRWMRHPAPPVERNAHRDAAREGES